MGVVLDFLLDSIQEEFLRPARFIRKIKNHTQLKILLAIPPKTANANQVIHWKRWEGAYFDKKYVLDIHKRPHTIQQYIPELEDLVFVSEIQNWLCDIRDIDCLSSSKSDLSMFNTLDDFATTVNHNLISEISEQNLNKNLRWERGRILDNPSFYRYTWDNMRIHLCNSGGSHHFSAARYLALKLNKKIPVRGRLSTFSLNPGSVFSLLEKFNLFSVRGEDWLFVLQECEHFNAPVGFYPAPKPFHNQIIIFLPRSNKRSVRIAKLFKQFQLFDFGLFLLKSLKIQES